MAYYLGVDGGGSHTRALLCDASGSPVSTDNRGKGLSGASNPRVTPPAELKAHLLNAIRQACPGVDAASIQAVHLGIAGCSDAASQATLANIAQECMQVIGAGNANITVGHDLETVLSANLDSRSGILIIAGTGSACYGRNDQGQIIQCGGWGDLVDDAGSGSWIGLRALQVAVRQADGRQSQSPLLRKVMEFLQIDHMDAFKTRIHQERLSRSERAGLTPVLFALAKSGDDAAAQILADAIKELCLLAESTTRQLQLSAPNILLAGGLTDDHTFYKSLVQALSTHIPGAHSMRPQLSGVASAVMLALRNAGINTGKATIQNLKNTFNI